VPALVPGAPFKYDKDFAPLIRIGTGYNVLVVNPSVPVHLVAELIAYLKKDPGKYTFSSGGFGTPAHLLGELFKLEAGGAHTAGPLADRRGEEALPVRYHRPAPHERGGLHIILRGTFLDMEPSFDSARPVILCFGFWRWCPPISRPD
jgi:Tripartite tricarboxylate transporter family receptor